MDPAKGGLEDAKYEGKKGNHMRKYMRKSSSIIG
jgi:hypothetical protein